MKKRVKVEVYGRVQGVGFRYFVLRNAKEFGVPGYVKNRPDRSVEIVMEGEDHSIDMMINAIKKGPVSSTVEKVRIHNYNYLGRYRDFQITG